MEENIVVLKSTFNKTPGMVYKIAPCPDSMGKWPSCVRRVDKDGEMILSENDKKLWNEGKIVLLPEDQPIIVTHGTTFNLDNPLQAAQWEAIKNSKMIAKEREEKDVKGNYIIDGGNSIIDKNQNAYGRYGLAELYIERPGRSAKLRNDLRKLIIKAQNLILDDSLDHRVLICKLFEKDYSHANSNDVEDFLLTQASKYPEKVIKFYNSEEASMRLLLIKAKENGVVVMKQDGLYYADIKLGSNIDFAVEYLKSDKTITDEIKKETFPELEKKTKK